jgi:hypothetical protein
VFKKSHECLKLLIDAKADVNSQQKKGMTGLHIACQGGDVECARLLIEGKANVHLQDGPNKDTALIHAVGKGQLDCVKLVIDAKADVNYRAPDGSNAFAFAVKFNYLSCLYLLLDQPSDATASGLVKSNALLRAFGPDDFCVSAQAQTTAFILLACGANVKESIKANVPNDRLESATSRYRNVQSFIDEWHGVALTALSDGVRVDTRVGLGDNGLYQEPLERVLQYLGLSMTVNQVVNTSVDGKSVRRALIPNQARVANKWHEQYKALTVLIAGPGR